MVGTLAFDVDGVLVEVSESYRETVVQTVRHFSGETISPDLIQDFKNAGGWNNDWLLTQRILADLGHTVDYDTVVEQFNRIFFGHNGTEGLILREVWLDTSGILARLSQRFNMAIFTGRYRYELNATFGRFATHLTFHPVMCADDVVGQKPHPEGLIRIRETYPAEPIWYLGDTVDDARAARAAGVPFIGIVSQDHVRRTEILELFRQENAVAILDDINQLESVLP